MAASTNERSTSLSQTTQTNENTKPWVPPTSDQEFVFKDVQSAPAWVDKSWAGYDGGPALAVPAGDVWGDGPYTTKFAHPGDTVKFTVAKGSIPAKFTIIPGDPVEATGAKLKPPAETNASYEDLVKQGFVALDDLGDAGKAGMALRSPGIARMIEADAQPKKQDMTYSGVS